MRDSPLRSVKQRAPSRSSAEVAPPGVQTLHESIGLLEPGLKRAVVVSLDVRRYGVDRLGYAAQSLGDQRLLPRAERCAEHRREHLRDVRGQGHDPIMALGLDRKRLRPHRSYELQYAPLEQGIAAWDIGPRTSDEQVVARSCGPALFGSRQRMRRDETGETGDEGEERRLHGGDVDDERRLRRRAGAAFEDGQGSIERRRNDEGVTALQQRVELAHALVDDPVCERIGRRLWPKIESNDAIAPAPRASRDRGADDAEPCDGERIQRPRSMRSGRSTRAPSRNTWTIWS